MGRRSAINALLWHFLLAFPFANGSGHGDFAVAEFFESVGYKGALEITVGGAGNKQGPWS